MFIVIDIILVAIFALMVFLAAKKGFIKSLLDFVAVIMAFVLAFALSTPVAQAVYDGFVEEIILDAVTAQIDENDFDAVVAAEEVVEVFEELPDAVINLAASIGIDFDKITDEIDFDEIEPTDSVKRLVRKIGEPLAVRIMSGVFFILLAVIFIIILKAAVIVISKVAKLPVIGQADTLLGGVLGALKGILVIALICTILRAFFMSGDSEFSAMVNESIIIKLFEDFVSPFSIK